jgi:hypothetical protein
MAAVTIAATPEKTRRGVALSGGRGLLGLGGAAGATGGSFVDSIDDVMAASHYQTMHWRKTKVGACNADVRRAIQELHRERAAVGDLKATLDATEELAVEASALHASSARAADMIRASAEAASARLAVASEGLRRLGQEQESCLEDLDAAERTLAEEQRAANARLAEIEGFFTLYEESLGLRITRSAPSVVKVAFSLLDDAVSEGECSFTIGLADPRTYDISGVCPPLPPKRVASLMERLNEAPSDPTALPVFCCAMRRAFKTALQKKGAAHGGA